MKEYTRRITGVIDTRYNALTIDDHDIRDILHKMLGEERQFAGTISIVVTDLTADTGAAEPEEGGNP